MNGFNHTTEKGLNSNLPYFRDFAKRDKKEAANGQRLHVWTIRFKLGRIAFYRCIYCDCLDNAFWPRTPNFFKACPTNVKGVWQP